MWKPMCRKKQQQGICGGPVAKAGFPHQSRTDLSCKVYVRCRGVRKRRETPDKGNARGEGTGARDSICHLEQLL